jgi:hypothetical protein
LIRFIWSISDQFWFEKINMCTCFDNLTCVILWYLQINPDDS